MAETSKNKIYYNDNENSVADVLADMKKMAESTDEAIEKSKYNDAAIKKSISDVEKKQVEKNTEQDSKIVELQTEKTKLEKELKEIQEDFYQNSIRGQASGEYIHVEDSSNCRAKIGIGGNHEQETSTQTENYVDDREARGKTISQATSLYLPIVNLKAGDNYYLKIFDKDNQLLQDSRYLAVEFYDANKTKIQDGPLGFPKSFTEEAVTKIKYAKIYYNGNDTDKAIGNAVIKKIGLKITSNASADDIDLFVPNMPSTDYPSSAKTVGSNVNLFDKEKYRNINNWSNSQGFFIYCKLDEEDTTKFKKIITGSISLKGKSQKLVFGISTTNNAGSFNNQYRMLDNGTIKNITYDFSNAENIYLCIGNANKIGTDKNEINLIFDNYNIKFEEGTVATPYSKYEQGCVKVTKCNKNILPLENKTSDWDKAQISIINNELTIKPNSSGNLPVVLDGNVYPFSLNKGTTITISWVYKNGDLSLDTGAIGVDLKLDYDDGTTNSLRTSDIVKANQKSTSSQTITLEKNVKSIHWYIFGWNVTNAKGSSKYNLQLEIGSKVTSFEQHEEQSYIMPVQKEMLEEDYFDYDNEEEVHVWGKVVLSGAETIVAFSLTDTRSVFYVKIDGMYVYKDKNSIPVLISDEFKVKKQIETWKVGDISRIIERPEYVALILAAGYTLDTFKELLATNKPKVYYKLAEPIRLKFTDEQKAVAKELNNARTYKNVTNITTDSKAILSLDYAKDLETLLNNTQALAVNNASEGV